MDLLGVMTLKAKWAIDPFAVVQSFLGNQGKQVVKNCHGGRVFTVKLLLDIILGRFFNFKK